MRDWGNSTGLIAKQSDTLLGCHHARFLASDPKKRAQLALINRLITAGQNQHGSCLVDHIAKTFDDLPQLTADIFRRLLRSGGGIVVCDYLDAELKSIKRRLHLLYSHHSHVIVRMRAVSSLRAVFLSRHTAYRQHT